MAAAGLGRPEIADAMQIPLTTLDGWRTDHRRLWDKETARAMESALILIRSQAGTDAVLDDPAAYILRARNVWPTVPRSQRKITAPRFGFGRSSPAIRY